ncbi:MAG: Ig-like domain-containing protein [Dokdonella sp.]|uniref:Ig-like domain-containing protein n=1 Tax=Dokdonella sp. TaxID=2291710 RepID=UPI0032652BC5
MQVRLITTAAVAVSLVGALSASVAQAYDYTAPVPFHTTVNFDPANGVIPFPNDLLLLGTTDLTLNIPVDPNAADAGTKTALNALDGFSTSAPWSLGFSQPLDATSLAGGVHVFEVTLSGPGGGVTGVVRELASPSEFVVALAPSDATARTVAIVPTAPLKERTSYMAVITNGIKTAAGDSVRGSLPYRLAERTTPLCSNGQSNVSALPASQACALEPLRQLISSQVAAASGAGVDAGSIVMSWVATTQSITPTLRAITGVIEASPAATVHTAPTGLTLGSLGLGLPPIADITIGTIDLPYYLTAPSAANPTAALTSSWHAAPGAYVPQCAPFGLDPTSTNLTACNPFPVATSTQTVPMLMTLPNAASGKVKPAAGWPLVIFQHGITRNRTDMFAIAGTLAAQGFAVVAIDLPLHGLTSPTNPFYIGNTPFAALGAHERTFDLDFTDNSTGASGPDGVIDTSGSYFINLTSLLTSRDNLRQGVADLLELSHAAGSLPNVDATHVRFVGQSLGSIVGTTFLAFDPNVQSGVLNVPGGGIARLLDASPAFGPRIHAGLAAAGIQQGTPAYDAYFVATQTVIDSGDPINMTVNHTYLTPRETSDDPFPKSILLQEVIGGGDVLPDQVIPNRVAGAPLSGTEPLIAALGLAPVSNTVLLTNGGLHGAVRFLEGDHGSILDPTGFPAATVEMQGEMASFVISNGNAVIVNNPSIVQGPQP